MSKVLCKILKFEDYTKLTGEQPKGSIVKLDYKIAMVLVKKEVVELAELEREMQGKKEEAIQIDSNPELIAYLSQPQLLNNLTIEVQKSVVGETNSIKTIILICCLAKVKNKRSTSSNLCANAAPGTGKDFVVSETLNIFPEENIFARRRVSEKALDYALARHQNRDWNNYFVYLEDVNSKILNSESVKTLMSANPNKINTVTIVHEGAAKDLSIKGKPTFLTTAAKVKAGDEALRRLPFLYMDESSQQTLQINLKQASEDAGQEQEEKNELAKRFYYGLDFIEVIIPYAEKITHALAEYWIKKSRNCQVIQRTIFSRFLDYIKGSACLHQHQRQKDLQGKILATPEDYGNARIALLQTTSNSLMIPLAREEKELIEILIKYFPDGGTLQNINIRFSRWEERWLRNTLDRLVQLGFLEKTKTHVEESKKDVAIYIPLPDVLTFSIPKWEEIEINAIHAVDTNNAINANHANENELHELHRISGVTNFGTIEKQAVLAKKRKKKRAEQYVVGKNAQSGRPPTQNGEGVVANA